MALHSSANGADWPPSVFPSIGTVSLGIYPFGSRRSIIGFPGRADAGAALFRNGVFDLVNELDNLVGFELVPLPGGFLEGEELRDPFLLLGGQLVVAVPCGVDGRAAVDRDRADSGNQVVHRFGLGLVVRLFQLLVLILGVSQLLVVCDLGLFFRTQSVIVSEFCAGKT